MRSWVSELQATGGEPVLAILAECVNAEEANALERRLIAQFRRPRLLNSERASISDKEPTEGRALLVQLLTADDGPTEREIGENTGVSQPSVSAWKNGWSRPDEFRRVLLEKRYAIPADSWRTQLEQERRSRLMTGLTVSNPQPETASF